MMVRAWSQISAEGMILPTYCPISNIWWKADPRPFWKIYPLVSAQTRFLTFYDTLGTYIYVLKHPFSLLSFEFGLRSRWLINELQGLERFLKWIENEV